MRNGSWCARRGGLAFASSIAIALSSCGLLEAPDNEFSSKRPKAGAGGGAPLAGSPIDGGAGDGAGGGEVSGGSAGRAGGIGGAVGGAAGLPGAGAAGLGKAGTGTGGKGGGAGQSGAGGRAGGGRAGSGGQGAGGGLAPACDECGLNAACDEALVPPSCVCNTGYVGNGRTCRRPVSCRELAEADPGLGSDVYWIRPVPTADDIQVRCDMVTDGGGWTLILNQGPEFDPTQRGGSNVCFNENCTSLAYSVVPVTADMMLDMDDEDITGASYMARLIVTGVHPATRGRTLYDLFNATMPHYLEQEDNANIELELRGGLTCDDLPRDIQRLLCPTCQSSGGCGTPVMAFGDGDSSCTSTPPRFAIGGAISYTEAWTNCAGWPQNPNSDPYNYYPDNFRIWVR